MPGELKARLADEVADRGSNLNDVAVGILASRFAVPFEPSGRKGAPPKGEGDVLLRMPADLKDRLQQRAADRGANTNELINEILAESLSAGEGSTQPMAATNGKAPRSEDRVRVAIVGVGVRPVPDARAARRLPRPRHRVHIGLPRHDRQGRQGPLRGDLSAPKRQ